MFVQHRSRTLVGAVFTTVALIYHQTVYNLRKTHSNALIGLLRSMLQALVMVLGFMAMYWIMGVRQSPLRGDMVMFVMSGIFLYMTHIQAASAVASAGNPTQTMIKHGPMNTGIAMCAGALAVLYQKVLAIAVILYVYHVASNRVAVEHPVQAAGILLMAWFSGCCVGLLLLVIRQWWPTGGQIATTVYMRANMVASGKMFVANVLPLHLLRMFDWNPLFHMIDQMRGALFINYSPRNSDLVYPVKVSLALLAVGLMAEFVTRQNVSLSQAARH